MILAAHAFRHYDIRGKVDQEIFVEEMYSAGPCYCRIYFARKSHRQKKLLLVVMDVLIHQRFKKI